MKIINEKPPMWRKLKSLFDFDDRTTVFTYGDAIYNPSGNQLSEDVIVHESVHIQQQLELNRWWRSGAREWWNRFIKDPKFRLEQEMQAYQTQYYFLLQRGMNRDQLAKRVSDMAYAMSSPMYGNVISYADAIRQIRLSTSPSGADTAR